MGRARGTPAACPYLGLTCIPTSSAITDTSPRANLPMSVINEALSSEDHLTEGGQPSQDPRDLCRPLYSPRIAHRVLWMAPALVRHRRVRCASRHHTDSGVMAGECHLGGSRWTIGSFDYFADRASCVTQDTCEVPTGLRWVRLHKQGCLYHTLP